MAPVPRSADIKTHRFLELYTMTSISEIDEQLARLNRGEKPAFAGPMIFYDFYTARRKRWLLEQREKLSRRAAMWLPPVKPKCRGPSIVDMAIAQLCSYVSTVAILASTFVFMLWYFGILAYIIWFFKALRTFFGLFVSNLSFFRALRLLLRVGSVVPSPVRLTLACQLVVPISPPTFLARRFQFTNWNR